MQSRKLLFGMPITFGSVKMYWKCEIQKLVHDPIECNQTEIVLKESSGV